MHPAVDLGVLGRGLQVLADRDEVDAVRAEVKSDGQSEAQISSAEFAQIKAGLSPSALRDLVGEPASEDSTELEGLELECMSYGIVGASGIYFCRLLRRRGRW